MPRFFNHARLYPGESFEGPDRDEVGCYTFAHLSSGRRVLLRVWREDRFNLSPAGRAYFLQFPQELQVHIPCVHVQEGRVFRTKDPYLSIDNEKFLTNCGAKGLGIVRVCGHATHQDMAALVRRRLTAFLETLGEPGMRILYHEYEGFVCWDETKDFKIDEVVRGTRVFSLEALLDRPLQGAPFRPSELQLQGLTPLAFSEEATGCVVRQLAVCLQKWKAMMWQPALTIQELEDEMDEAWYRLGYRAGVYPYEMGAGWRDHGVTTRVVQCAFQALSWCILRATWSTGMSLTATLLTQGALSWP